MVVLRTLFGKDNVKKAGFVLFVFAKKKKKMV
jgi:hypothetical protein